MSDCLFKRTPRPHECERECCWMKETTSVWTFRCISTWCVLFLRTRNFSIMYLQENKRVKRLNRQEKSQSNDEWGMGWFASSEKKWRWLVNVDVESWWILGRERWSVASRTSHGMIYWDEWNQNVRSAALRVYLQLPVAYDDELRRLQYRFVSNLDPS